MSWIDKLKASLGSKSTGIKPASDEEKVATPEQQSDDLWQQVYGDREKFYTDHVGELPSDILKIGHMFGIWPGGGLFAIPASKIGAGCWAYHTYQA